MTQKEQRRRLAVKRFELAKTLAADEGYEHLTIYRQTPRFVAYEANDLFRLLKPIYIVVEYDDDIPYLALRSVVDEM